MTDHVVQVADAADIADDAAIEEPPTVIQLHVARAADDEPASGEFAPSINDPTAVDTRPFRVARAPGDDPHPNPE